MKRIQICIAALFVIALALWLRQRDAKSEIFYFENPPEIGHAPDGASIRIGGLSGLQVESEDGSNIVLLANTDRGPNAPRDGKKRPFLMPEFHPRLVRLRVDRTKRTVEFLSEVALRDQDGKPFTGLPNYQANLKDSEIGVDPGGNQLPVDPHGIDPESICFAQDGTLWMGEEYGPDLLHFDREGDLIERFGPGKGLADWLEKRRANNGFEGIGCADGKIYALLQAPLATDKSDETKIHFIEFDPKTKQTTGSYIYKLETPKSKIGDLFALGGGRFLVIEQNGRLDSDAQRVIYEFDLQGRKKEVLDLVQLGFNFEKIEGLALLKDGSLVMISDNDFGLSDKGIDVAKKTAIGIFKSSKLSIYK